MTESLSHPTQSAVPFLREYYSHTALITTPPWGGQDRRDLPARKKQEDLKAFLVLTGLP